MFYVETSRGDRAEGDSIPSALLAAETLLRDEQAADETERHERRALGHGWKPVDNGRPTVAIALGARLVAEGLTLDDIVTARQRGSLKRRDRKRALSLDDIARRAREERTT